MKLNLLKFGAVALLLSNVFVSCETDEELILEENLSVEDVLVIGEIDAVIDDIGVDIDQAYILEENIGSLTSKGSSGKNGSGFFPECLTKTVVIEENMKIVTLDFGEGCEVRGRFISGILIMTYDKDSDLHTKTIIVTYDNYRVNRKLIEGSHSIVRTRENDNPKSIITFDVMVTWDNGDTATRVGEKVREMIEGSDTRTWSDNVYLITGHWTTTRKNGAVVYAKIVTPLRRELVCRFLVSGTIDLNKNDKHGILDFGEGECDNMATLTLDDGTVIEITLPKRH